MWLKKAPKPKTPGLPDPSNCISDTEVDIICAANNAVDLLSEECSDSSKLTPKKRKRGEYSMYDETIRAKIAVYAIDNGIMKATRKFSAELNRKVSESTRVEFRLDYC